MTQKDTPKYLIVGEVLRPHGIRGELRVRLLTDYPERITTLKKIYLGVGPGSRKISQHEVEQMRMNKGYGLLKLKGITDRSQADVLRDLYVMVGIEDAVPLEDDEIYLFQLIGMRVELEDGSELGTVKDVIETGANDVYIVDSPQHGEVLIPITPETLLETDDENTFMRVKLPDGLLPDA